MTWGDDYRGLHDHVLHDHDCNIEQILLITLFRFMHKALCNKLNDDSC